MTICMSESNAVRIDLPISGDKVDGLVALSPFFSAGNISPYAPTERFK